jgi:hypothetical protein
MRFFGAKTVTRSRSGQVDLLIVFDRACGRNYTRPRFAGRTRLITDSLFTCWLTLGQSTLTLVPPALSLWERRANPDDALTSAHHLLSRSRGLNYTPNEWRRCSFHVMKIISYSSTLMNNIYPTLCLNKKNYTPNECGSFKTTLQASGEVLKLHSKQVG